MDETKGIYTRYHGYDYFVLNESVFLEMIDLIKGRYYEDMIRNPEDLITAFNVAVRFVKDKEKPTEQKKITE
jgi:hypothetical protein